MLKKKKREDKCIALSSESYSQVHNLEIVLNININKEPSYLSASKSHTYQQLTR